MIDASKINLFFPLIFAWCMQSGSYITKYLHSHITLNK